MDILDAIVSVLTSPSRFFGKLKERELAPAFQYFAVLSLIYIALGAVLGYFLAPVETEIISSLLGVPIETPETGAAFLAVTSVLGYGFALLLSFVVAGFLHVWILLFGGKGDYVRTYQLYVYSDTPQLLFGWLPIVNWFMWIYSLGLLIIGTQKLHKISRTKSMLMFLIPAGIFLMALIGFWIFLIYLAQSDPSLFAEI